MAKSNSQAALLLAKQLRGMNIHSVVLFCCSLRSNLKLSFILFFFNFIWATSDLRKSPVEGFSAGLVDDSNVFEWEIIIIGPPDTL